jgi:hypothetical protein
LGDQSKDVAINLKHTYFTRSKYYFDLNTTTSEDIRKISQLFVSKSHPTNITEHDSVKIASSASLSFVACPQNYFFSSLSDGKVNNNSLQPQLVHLKDYTSFKISNIFQELNSTAQNQRLSQIRQMIMLNSDIFQFLSDLNVKYDFLACEEMFSRPPKSGNY